MLHTEGSNKEKAMISANNNNKKMVNGLAGVKSKHKAIYDMESQDGQQQRQSKTKSYNTDSQPSLEFRTR